jgi:hypothetical protein
MQSIRTSSRRRGSCSPIITIQVGNHQIIFPDLIKAGNVGTRLVYKVVGTEQTDIKTINLFMFFRTATTTMAKYSQFHFI